jgi:hypothetical protein
MSRPAITLLAVAIALGAAGDTHAQTARLHVLADSAAVGEPFDVAVAVDRQPGTQVVFERPPRGDAAVGAPLLAGDAELTALRRLPPRQRGDLRTDSAVYRAVVFTLDSARVGPLAVRLVAGGDTTIAAAPAGQIGVRHTALAEAAELRPPAPLATFPRASWPWLAAAVFLLAVVLAVSGWLRKRGQRPDDGAPAEAPDVQAMRRIEALAAAPPPAGSAAAYTFYVELADILRTYLARASPVRARERTTGEILRDLAALPDPPPGPVLTTLGILLRRADVVKFAGVDPPPGAFVEDLQSARDTVAAVEHARAEREAARLAAESPAVT